MSQNIFAYGSNMCSGRLRNYGVSPRAAGRAAVLTGYQLLLRPAASRLLLSRFPALTVRFLFAYHELGYPGPTVGRHEFAPRSKRGNTAVPETLGTAQPCAGSLLRLPGNAAPLALLPSKSPACGKADSPS